MRELLNSNDTSTIKQGDSSETLRLSARNDNEPITWSSDDTAEAHVDTEDGAFVTKFPVDLVTNSNNVNIDSQNLAQLKAGKYTLEVWVKLANGRNAIYPSDGGLEVTIDRNADDIESSDRVTTITLDDFKQQVMKSVQDQIANANLTDKTGQKVDLSDYAKKTDVPNIVYNSQAHTLTINGQSLIIPESVDLSGYAKTGDVPSVKLDGRKLTVDGVSVDIPQDVDLGGYYTKAEVDSKVANAAAGGKVDLSGYVTVTDADKKYATKSEIPDVSNFVTSEAVAETYATKSEANETFATKAEIPSVPDVSSFITSQDVATTYATKSEIPSVPDVSSFITSEEVASEYAMKSEIPTMPDLNDYVKAEALSSYATKSEIPTIPDLTPYATKSYVTSEVANIKPASVDLSSYETISHAESTFVHLGAIDAVLSQYAKVSSVYDKDYINSNYLTNSDTINAINNLVSLRTGQLKQELNNVEARALTPYNFNQEAEMFNLLDSYATQKYVDDKVASIKPSSSSSSSMKQLYGDIVPTSVKSVHIVIRFGIISVTYTQADGTKSYDNVLSGAGTLAFNMLNQGNGGAGIPYDIAIGPNELTKFTIPENVIKGTTTLDITQTHVMSIDYETNNWIIIHAVIPTEIINDQPVYENGGQLVDIITSGLDRKQPGNMGSVSIQVHPTIIAQ